MSSYSDPLDTRTTEDGRLHLLRDLKYHVVHKSDKLTATVKSGFGFDGASLPRLFWSIMGSPTSVKLFRPGTVHDWLYWKHAFDQGSCTRKEADKVFREAMLVSQMLYREAKLDDLVDPGLITTLVIMWSTLVTPMLDVAQRWLAWAAVRVFGKKAWDAGWPIPEDHDRIDQGINAEINALVAALTNA